MEREVTVNKLLWKGTVYAKSQDVGEVLDFLLEAIEDGKTDPEFIVRYLSTVRDELQVWNREGMVNVG